MVRVQWIQYSGYPFYIGTALTLSEGEPHKKRRIENDAKTNTSKYVNKREVRRLKGVELFNRYSNRINR